MPDDALPPVQLRPFGLEQPDRPRLFIVRLECSCGERTVFAVMQGQELDGLTCPGCKQSGRMTVWR